MAQKAKKQGKSKNGNKTHGRNKDWCKAYLARGQRAKNKAIRLARHRKLHPNDGS
jgi:hypothetical protein